MALRERGRQSPGAVDPDRLRGLIELAESAAGDPARRGQAADSLLTLPAGDEVDAVETELLGSLVDPIESAGASEARDRGAGRAGA